MKVTKEQVTETKTACYHCGLECDNDAVALKDKLFCCTGCRTVYEILSGSGLGSYYRVSDSPGARPNHDELNSRFAFLDDPTVLLVLDILLDPSIVPPNHCYSTGKGLQRR